MPSSYRTILLIAAIGFSVASTQGNRRSSQQPGANGPPPPGEPGLEETTSMDPSRAIGLWKSNFGAVKIEAEPNQDGNIRGAWLYQRNGEEVVGYFAGALSGNMLSFEWEEPTSNGAPLAGGGYLLFDPSGQSFQGKWWTTNRDRGGDWSGWRGQTSGSPPPSPALQGDAQPEQLEPEPLEPEPLGPPEQTGDFI